MPLGIVQPKPTAPGNSPDLPHFSHQPEHLLPHRAAMVFGMITTLKPAEPFTAAAATVERQIALGTREIAVHPLVEELEADFPRHGPQELSAAVITAIAICGASMRWRA